MSDRDAPAAPTGSSAAVVVGSQVEPMTKPPPTTSAAERQRRHRERRAAGVRVVQVEVNQEAIARLIALGWLSEVEAQDRSRVTTALENMIDCYGRGTLDPVPIAVSTSTNL